MADIVNHPSHYAEGWSNGAEVIDITENLNFNRGNAVKYIARAGKKDAAKELEDLEKAEFYVKREIALVRNRWDNPPTYRVVPSDPEPRQWESLEDIPSDAKAVNSAGGCRWRNYANEPGPIGQYLTGWFWSDAHARENGYKYDETGPFTEILGPPPTEGS